MSSKISRSFLVFTTALFSSLSVSAEDCSSQDGAFGKIEYDGKIEIGKTVVYQRPGFVTAPDKYNMVKHLRFGRNFQAPDQGSALAKEFCKLLNHDNGGSIGGTEYVSDSNVSALYFDESNPYIVVTSNTIAGTRHAVIVSLTCNK